MAENTLGRRILNKEPQVKIEGTEFELKAQVKSIDGFSAHADYNEILEWISGVDTSRLKKIILVHGDKESQIALKEKLESCGYSVIIQEKEKSIKLI